MTICNRIPVVRLLVLMSTLLANHIVLGVQQTKNIPEDIEQAKKKGLTEIHIPEPKIVRPVAANIDHILKVDSVVVATLVDKQSEYSDKDKTAIVTWLRFDVLEHVAGPLVPNLPPPADAPAKLTRNFNAGSSFLVRVFGGTLYQNGVKVVGDSLFAGIPTHKNYALFVFFDNDAREALGGFNFGPESVIQVADDGSLQSLNGTTNHAINRFLANGQLHDLESLKIAIRDRAHTLGR